jgi:hypothetical protein
MMGERWFGEGLTTYTRTGAHCCILSTLLPERLETWSMSQMKRHGDGRGIATPALSSLPWRGNQRTLQQAFEEDPSLEERQCAASDLTTTTRTGAHCHRACCQRD